MSMMVSYPEMSDYFEFQPCAPQALAFQMAIPPVAWMLMRSVLYDTLRVHTDRGAKQSNKFLELPYDLMTIGKWV